MTPDERHTLTTLIEDCFTYDRVPGEGTVQEVHRLADYATALEREVERLKKKLQGRLVDP